MLGVRALFGIIVKSRSLEGGVVLCGKTEVDVLHWYKGEKRRQRSGKKEGPRGLKRAGDRGDGASPLQRHRIEEVALVAASMRYEGGRNAGGAFEGGGEGGSSDGGRVMWQGCEDAACLLVEVK